MIKRHRVSFILMAAVMVATVFGYRAIMHGAGYGEAFASSGAYLQRTLKDRELSYAERNAILRSISYSPDNILRIQGRDVRAILSDPELVRTDLPTVIWQYRNASCVLDVYFSTMDHDPQFAPVVHYEVRFRTPVNESESESAQKHCVRDLLQNTARPRMVGVSTFYKAHEQ